MACAQMSRAMHTIPTPTLHPLVRMYHLLFPTALSFLTTLQDNECRQALTRRNREVINFTRYRVKNNSKLTNFRKFTRIEGYNGKYGSNPQGIKEFLDVIFKFDQIRQEIDGRN